MKIFNRETLREKLLEEKVKELEEIIAKKEERAKKEQHKSALQYLKVVCENYKKEEEVKGYGRK